MLRIEISVRFPYPAFMQERDEIWEICGGQLARGYLSMTDIWRSCQH